MRINSLNLSRFGHFNDELLSFNKPTNSPDFHLIYGPNEAGKSTTLAALVELLFGMPRSSQYAFIHDYESLEIIAQVQSNGTSKVFKRYKNKLTDELNQTLASHAIDVHGLSKEAFMARFTFDEEALKAGGEAILQNHGELGSALYSATSGLSNVDATIEQLMLPANAFYEPRKEKNKRLVELKKELQRISEQQKKVDVLAPAWSRQKNAAQEQKERYEQLLNDTRATKEQLTTRQAQREALLAMQHINTVEQQLQAIGELPNAPHDWLEKTRVFVTEEAVFKSQFEQSQKRRLTISEALEQHPVNSMLLQQADVINDCVRENTLNSHRENDNTALDIELRMLVEKRHQCEKKLGVEQFAEQAQIKLAASKLVSLEKHIQRYIELETTQRQAKRELAQVQLEHSTHVAQKLSPALNLDVLSTLVKQLQTEALPQCQEQAMAHQMQSLDSHNKAFSLLHPWQGTAQELQRLALPDEQHRQNISEQMQQADAAIKEKTQQLNKLENQLAEQHALASALSIEYDANSVTQTRTLRDTAWQQHQNQIQSSATQEALLNSAEQVSSAVKINDCTVDIMLNSSEKAGRYKQIQAQLAATESDISALKSSLDSLTKQRLALQTETASVATALQLPENTTQEHISRWIRQREQAVATIEPLQQAQQQLQAIELKLNNACSRLRSLMSFCEPKAQTVIGEEQHEDAIPKYSIPELEQADYLEIMAHANALLQKAQTHQGQYTQWQEMMQRLTQVQDQREQSLKLINDELAEWQQRWHESLKDTGLTESDPHSVSNMLENLRELNQIDEKASQLQVKKEQLQALSSQFKSKQSALFTSLVQQGVYPDSSEITLEQLANELRLSLDNQRLTQQFNTELTKLDAEFNALEAKIKPIEHELKDMFAFCSVTNTTELQTLLERVLQRDELIKKRQEHQLAINHTLKLEDFEQARETLQQLDLNTLDAEIDRLSLESESHQKATQDQYHAYRQLQDQIEQLDSNAESARLSQERTTVLQEIQQQTLSTIQLRLGKLAIQQALKLYRDKHKSNMMQLASQAFNTITSGSFTGLKTQLDEKNNDQLIGIKHDGRSVVAKHMSTGTRTQLYLALRIAAYHEYCEQREPLPFVADDIMETFDDERASATFSVLGEMANKGQVIYLTHHQHLIDIAKHSIGDNINVCTLEKRQ